ncbi:DUF134 domain-containing protein [Beduini massiliensis]|uniref:DUF134 domain-containing protein n=1 Tax=Beduini massiliensis TaxID=1585974 RepID=UPI00059A8DB2|nr:DUF134 domain-containing protein [Beduini massiliensis]
MARPTRCRRVCMEPAYDCFQPDGVPTREEVMMTLDEYETIRLIDLEKRTHEQCAKQMEISRTTVTEIYETARQKLADSVVNGKRLYISGGHYQLCDGTASFCCNKKCRYAKTSVKKIRIQRKEENQMRIAVTYENGKVFQHFGHTKQFKFYDVEDKKVVKSQIVDTNGQGHGALSEFLTQAGVDMLICGGIGGGAQTALSNTGIPLYGGVTGEADEAVNAYLTGELNYDVNVHCSHHEHEHHCGEHHCGEDKHGCVGNGKSCQ